MDNIENNEIIENIDVSDNKFKKAKIYKLVSKNINDDDEPLIYIGSTCKILKTRLNGHLRHYKIYLNNKFNFLTSFKLFEKYGVDNVDIILLEECNNITNKLELLKREKYYIDNNICVNKIKPSRTKKEWNKENNYNEKYYNYNKENYKKYREDNKEHYKKYREDNKEHYKKYREDNKEKYKEYQKKYKEYQKKYRDDNKVKIKEYFEDKKDKFKVYNKKYYENNKEKLKEYQKKYYEDKKLNNNNNLIVVN